MLNMMLPSWFHCYSVCCVIKCTHTVLVRSADFDKSINEQSQIVHLFTRSKLYVSVVRGDKDHSEKTSHSQTPY
jgi:hypothetical protein